jgi:hypothetical protein
MGKLGTTKQSMTISKQVGGIISVLAILPNQLPAIPNLESLINYWQSFFKESISMY